MQNFLKYFTYASNFQNTNTIVFGMLKENIADIKYHILETLILLSAGLKKLSKFGIIR